MPSRTEKKPLVSASNFALKVTVVSASNFALKVTVLCCYNYTERMDLVCCALQTICSRSRAPRTEEHNPLFLVLKGTSKVRVFVQWFMEQELVSFMVMTTW